MGGKTGGVTVVDGLWGSEDCRSCPVKGKERKVSISKGKGREGWERESKERRQKEEQRKKNDDQKCI